MPNEPSNLIQTKEYIITQRPTSFDQHLRSFYYYDIQTFYQKITMLNEYVYTLHIHLVNLKP
jgi:hypothetical protein